jgi:L-iditol 2-dehydrogenase
MRAVQVVAPGKVVFVEAPKPAMKPGHALVRTQRVSLCGSDIHMIDYSHPEEYPYPPGSSGHEMVGVVEAVDDPSGQIKVGDVALTLAPGSTAMAEYYLAQLEHVLVLPKGKPIEHLLQAQQLGTIIYACKFLPTPVLDKDVVVIGQGSAGLWWSYMMRRLGARRVITVDLQAHRLVVSKHYGATHTIHNAEVDAETALKEILGGRLADVVVEAAGEPDSIRLAVQLVRRHGSLVYFGVPRLETLEYPFYELFRKCVLLRTIVGATQDPGQSCTWLAIDLIAKGEADVGPMLTHLLPFEQVLDAYDLQRTRDEGAIKIVVKMPE